MKFKLTCHNCDEEVIPVVTFKHPHFKAECSECGKFIKFLNKKEKEDYHELN